MTNSHLVAAVDFLHSPPKRDHHGGGDVGGINNGSFLVMGAKASASSWTYAIFFRRPSPSTGLGVSREI